MLWLLCTVSEWRNQEPFLSVLRIDSQSVGLAHMIYRYQGLERTKLVNSHKRAFFIGAPGRFKWPEWTQLIRLVMFWLHLC